MKIAIPNFPNELRKAIIAFHGVAPRAWQIASLAVTQGSGVTKTALQNIDWFASTLMKDWLDEFFPQLNSQAKTACLRACRFATRALGDISEDRVAIPHPLHLALVAAEADLPTSLHAAFRHWVGQYLWRTLADDVSSDSLQRSLTSTINHLEQTGEAGPLDPSDAAQRVAHEWLGTLGIALWLPRERKLRRWESSPGLSALPVAVGSLIGHLVLDPGLAQVLGGGLRTYDEEGLVTLLAGGPGTGKTSLSSVFAMAAILEGGAAAFFSLEETTAAIRHKLVMTTPFATTAEIMALEERAALILVGLDDAQRADGDLLTGIRKRTERLLAQRAGDIGATTPLCCVMDSLSAFALLAHDSPSGALDAASARKSLADIVATWRVRGVHSVLVMGSAPSSLSEQAEHLADNVIELSIGDRKRYIRVLKTRLQTSHPELHVLHISEPGGVRVFPGMISQMKVFKRQPLTLSSEDYVPLVWVRRIRDDLSDEDLSDEEQLILPLSGNPKRGGSGDNVLRIAACAPVNSHVTVLGSGSAGKALYALRVLYSHTIQDLLRKDRSAVPATDVTNHGTGRKGDRRVTCYLIGGVGDSPTFEPEARVLVVSFHHPREVYSRQFGKIKWTGPKPARVGAALACLRLYPGELEPAVLMRKVERLLERGAEDGAPFTGALVDGIHNALLAFPRIAADASVWPTLIGLFASFGVTLVTTYSAMAVRLASIRAEYRFGGERTNCTVVEDILLARSNSTVLFGEINGRTAISIPDTTSIRQARDIAFFWSGSSGDFIERPRVIREVAEEFDTLRQRAYHQK